MILVLFWLVEHDGDFCPSSEEDGSDSSSCVLTEEDDDSDFDASPHPKGAGKGKGAKVGQKKITSEAEKRKAKAKEKKVVAKPTASKGLFQVQSFPFWHKQMEVTTLLDCVVHC